MGVLIRRVMEKVPSKSNENVYETSFWSFSKSGRKLLKGGSWNLVAN